MNAGFKVKKIEKAESSDAADQDPISNFQPRLWIVSELYYPEETSTGYYLTKIAEGLVASFDVKVLCGQPNYSKRGNYAPKKEIHRSVEIFRVWGTVLDKNVIIFRLINMLTLSFSVFVKALFNFQKNDRILVVTTPPLLPFIAALASLVRGASYVLLIHDNYPEILVAVGKTKKNSLLVGILDFFNRWLYKHAEKIIVVGRDMQDLVESKTLGLGVPIEYIPNWAELEGVKPSNRKENPLLKLLGLSEKLVFLYAGNMGHPNDLESIVKCSEKLKDNSEFHFVFLGAGVKKKWLEMKIVEKNLTNVTVLPPRPRSEQNIFLNACDVALVSLVKNMWGVSMPSRTYNILAVGKPILALTEANSEVARVIEENALGWIVSPDNPEKLFQTIIEISRKKPQLISMGKRARNAAIEKYSAEIAIQKYKKALLF
ncbi:MAG: glycosyltransferase family 4 protein [Acidobacteriota bacterium]|nr:glycosyltransferase family 4 protein [Acidobacteriota bacterium]